MKKRDSHIVDLKKKVSAANGNIKKLKRKNKKLKSTNRILNSFSFKAHLKLYRIFTKLFKGDKEK